MKKVKISLFAAACTLGLFQNMAVASTYTLRDHLYAVSASKSQTLPPVLVSSTNPVATGNSEMIFLRSFAQNDFCYGLPIANLVRLDVEVISSNGLVAADPVAYIRCGETSTNTLSSDQKLLAGQSRRSSDGRFTLSYQGDGNLVLYKQGTVIWATNKLSTPGSAQLNADGNFVVYDGSGTPIWATNTKASNAQLVVQNNGDVVLYNSSAMKIWSTGTAGR